MADLEGRVVAVTGASSGIGRAIAIQSASEGARVACCGRNAEKLEAVRSELPGDGHAVYIFDSEDLPGVESMAAAIAKGMGPLGGFVHSAGVSVTQLLRDTSYDVMEDLLRINFTVFLAFARGACRRGRYVQSAMSVVGISSMAALSADSGMSIYAASKAALNASIKSLAKEYASRGVRFNGICPNPVNTPMTDKARFLMGDSAFAEFIEKSMPLGLIEPEDVADSAIFLLSDKSRRITGSLLEITSGASSFSYV
ncbi:MAG: SDR family oxidoreductase [Synergistaceae bacterium]|jgi:NAD(P)-dependent dehydrogenase (short-subunit alcohol dehydrogenase family)|nr:SDR family oxidoreductase [Synergistaceae bacterium]